MSKAALLVSSSAQTGIETKSHADSKMLEASSQKTLLISGQVLISSYISIHFRLIVWATKSFGGLDDNILSTPEIKIFPFLMRSFDVNEDAYPHITSLQEGLKT